MKLGRINVVTDLWIGNSEAVRDVINQLLEQNGGDKVDVLLTSAGFLWAEKGQGKGKELQWKIRDTCGICGDY
jgi:hypothetical protein